MSNSHEKTLGELFSGVRVSTLVVVVGAVGVIVGSIGPWVTTVLGSVAGMHGDGQITLILGVVVLFALGIGRFSPTAGAIAAVIAIIAALAVAGYDTVHIDHEASRLTLFGHQVAGAGWGVYLAVIAAGVAGVGLSLRASMPIRSFAIGVCALAVLGIVVAGAALGGSRAPAAAAASTRGSAATTAGPRTLVYEEPSVIQGLKVQPSTLVMAGDGNDMITGLRWSGWGSSTARATGVNHVNNCVPSCSDGYVASVRVSVDLFSPGYFRGNYVYRCYAVKPSAPAYLHHFCLP